MSDKIEVTEAMAEAGRDVLNLACGKIAVDLGLGVVETIYRAMERIRLTEPSTRSADVRWQNATAGAYMPDGRGSAERPRKIVQATPYQDILANGATQMQVLAVDDRGDVWFTNLPEEGWVCVPPLPSDAP